MPKKPYTIGPFGSDMLAQVKVSPGAVWEGAGTRFLHPKREKVITQAYNYQIYTEGWFTGFHNVTRL